METLPRIQSLIAALEAGPDRDVLSRLREATAISADLSTLGDGLVNHFVEAAREEGRSWVEIGEVLGMTKQAAQQRFRLRWFDRLIGRRGGWMHFTDRARSVVAGAVEEARGLQHNYVGTEHVLLALVRVKDGVAARALRDLGVTAADVRRAVETKVGTGDIPVIGSIAYTPWAKEVLYGAREEARSLGHNYVGTEHLLLALARLRQGLAAEIFQDKAIGAGEVRRSVTSLLARPGRRTTEGRA